VLFVLAADYLELGDLLRLVHASKWLLTLQRSGPEWEGLVHKRRAERTLVLDGQAVLANGTTPNGRARTTPRVTTACGEPTQSPGRERATMTFDSTATPTNRTLDRRGAFCDLRTGPWR
jgi:hypothetical protein